MRLEQVAGVDLQIPTLIWQHWAARGFVLGILVSWVWC
jgi:hypothetical protein